MELDKIKNQTTWNDASASINANFQKLLLAIENALSEAGVDEAQLEEYLVQNGYTTEDWVKAQNFLKSIDGEMSDTSENAVQNKVIKAYADLHPQYEVVEEIEAPESPGGNTGEMTQEMKEMYQWYIQIKDLLVVENGNVRIKTNAVIDGDTATR